jgi:hypothetical protein
MSLPWNEGDAEHSPLATRYANLARTQLSTSEPTILDGVQSISMSVSIPLFSASSRFVFS